MKIGLITAFYDEKEKGNEYYLAKHLSKLGNEVIIYVSKYSVPRYGKLKIINSSSKLKNVKVKRLDSFGIYKKGMIVLRNLRKEIKKDNLDIIHLQEWFMPMGFQLRNSKNLVLTQRIERMPRIIKLIYYLYGKRLLKNAEAITTLTTQAKEELKKLNIKKKIKVISNGVDTEIFKPTKSKNNQKREPHFLFVGRISKEKGLDLLIKAIKKTKYKLKIIGDGPERNNLINYSSEKIKFLGKIKQENLKEYYSNADALIIPSLKEPFGFVTLESLACGTPVAGTNIGGMRDVINEKVGIKFKTNNVNEIIKALDYMKKNSKELRKNCTKYIKENYSWDIVAKKYFEIYKEVKKGVKK